MLMKLPNIKLHENPFNASGAVTCEQTVRLLETFLKLLFGNAPERDKIRKQKKEGK
jgi:hypothetical protein